MAETATAQRIADVGMSARTLCFATGEVDEPTTGLHPAEIDRLLGIVDRLITGGNTVVVIEHNLDVIAAADWIVDLGSEGGKDGAIVAEDTPETIVAHHATSHTGRYLKEPWPRLPIEPSPRRRRPSGYPGGDDRAAAISSGAGSGPVAPRMRGFGAGTPLFVAARGSRHLAGRCCSIGRSIVRAHVGVGIAGNRTPS